MHFHKKMSQQTTTKQVRFNLSGTDTYYVSHLKDLSDRQKRRIWYSREEYDGMKFEIDEKSFVWLSNLNIEVSWY